MISIPFRQHTNFKTVGNGFLLAIGIFIILILAIAAYIGFKAKNYINVFTSNTGTTPTQLYNEAKSGYNDPYQGKYITFLLLGLDQRENGNSLLTDTIMLITVNSESGNYLLLSLPRDLWIKNLETKINALYYYGQEHDPENPTKLVEETIENILGCEINYTAILKMDEIKDLIDMVGGIEVEVERSFTDHHFPDEVSGGEMTISFEQGKNYFDGERAMQFIRSRQSEDEIEGTDEARQIRQKKVILALKNKLMKDVSLWLNPVLSANIYNYIFNDLEITPKLDLQTSASYWIAGKNIFLKGQQKELELKWKGDDSILIPSRDEKWGSWILIPRSGEWGSIKNFYYSNLP
jgi:LCP family protein required for cell wall assembly